MSSDELKNIIWVNKLSKNVTDDDVREHFKECGEIKIVFICSSRNRNFTYCFVEFTDENGAQKALEKNDTELGDGQVVVALADNRQYERSVRRTETRTKLNEKVEEEIKDMDKTSSYYYGFIQGKKYMLRKMTRTNPRRNVRYVRKQRRSDYEKLTDQYQQLHTQQAL